MCPNSTFVVVCRLGLNIDPKRLGRAPPFNRDAAADRLPWAKHQPGMLCARHPKISNNEH